MLDFLWYFWCNIYKKIPLQLTFSDEIKSNFFDIFKNFIICFYFLDIIQNFNIAVLVNGELIYDRKVIAKNYLKYWFGIDLISTIPFELIVNYLNNIN